MLSGVPTEVRKGAFVRLHELRQALIGTGVIEPAAAEPQREDKHVHDVGPGAERHRGLSPINLTLVPGRRLKA
jgi:hypothetical protein